MVATIVRPDSAKTLSLVTTASAMKESSPSRRERHEASAESRRIVRKDGEAIIDGGRGAEDGGRDGRNRGKFFSGISKSTK